MKSRHCDNENQQESSYSNNQWHVFYHGIRSEVNRRNAECVHPPSFSSSPHAFPCVLCGYSPRRCQFLYSSSTPFAYNRRTRSARRLLELQGVTSVQEAEQPERNLVVNARFDAVIYDERISFILDLPKSLALVVRETPFVLSKTNLLLFFVLKNTNIMPCVGNARKYNTPAYSTLPTGSSGQTSAESGVVHSKGDRPAPVWLHGIDAVACPKHSQADRPFLHI